MTNYCYITEFAGLSPQVPGFIGQIAMQPPVAEQAFVISGTSAQSATFNKKTTVIRVMCDTVAAIEIGANPTAIAAGTTGTMRMNASVAEYFGIPEGGYDSDVGTVLSTGYQLAAITST